MAKKTEKSSFVGKFLITFFILAILFLGAVGGLGWWLLDKTIDEAPPQPPVMAFVSADAGQAFAKMRPLGMTVMRSHPGQTEELTLTPGEANALFSLLNQARTLAVMLNLGRCDWPKGLWLKMEGRELTIQYSIQIKRQNPFGQFLNLQLAFEPKMRDGKIDYRITNAQIGSLHISPGLLKRIIDWQYDDKSDELKVFKQLIVSFYVDDAGSLRLKFYPFELRQLIANAQKKISLSPANTPPQ
jgi:hypothetical protein